MLDQRYNTNKENNSLVNNLDMEEQEPDTMFSSSNSNKILQQNHNISNTMELQQLQYQKQSQQCPQIQQGSISTASLTSEMDISDAKGDKQHYNKSHNELNYETTHTSTNSNVPQQLLNDVRSLALQNQKTEQNIRELQQKINLQKGKRLTYANGATSQVEDKENNYEKLQQSKPLRHHSTSIQPSTSLQNGLLKQQSLNLANETNKPNATSRQSLQEPSKQALQNKQTIEIKPKHEELKPAEPTHAAAAEHASTSHSSTSSSQQDKGESISAKLARVIINENYSHDILNHIRQSEHKIVPKNSLLRHRISVQLRAKMIDWMIEVMKSYKCSEESFFMAVRIMDMYLEKTKVVKGDNDLHLIGVTCIFIACKFEEIIPIRLQVVEERIAHRKLSCEQIKEMEVEILNTLNFNLMGTSPYEILMQTLTLTGYQERFSAEEFQYGQKIGLYLTKMSLYDYEFNKTTPYSLLAASVIFIVFKIFQQINPQFAAEAHIRVILQVLKIDSRDLVMTSTRILQLSKTFEQFFPNLQNLKKFNGFEMLENEHFSR